MNFDNRAPAKLNLGVVRLRLAKGNDARPRFKGDDFGRTDLGSVSPV